MLEARKMTLELVADNGCKGCVFRDVDGCHDVIGPEFECGSGDLGWKVTEMPAPPQACA